jgi:CheY-like chemotaxis protein
MSAGKQEQILLVDDNHMFREALAQRLRTAGYQVTIADTGEQAFWSVRSWERPIGWLYTRAALPRLIDGWILADAYHEVHAHRPVVVSSVEARQSGQDIILRQPTPAAVMSALLSAMRGELLSRNEDATDDVRRAA